MLRDNFNRLLSIIWVSILLEYTEEEMHGGFFKFPLLAFNAFIYLLDTLCLCGENFVYLSL